MLGFNPDFWEVTIDHNSWKSLTEKDSIFYREPPGIMRLEEKLKAARKLKPTLYRLIDEALSPPQKKVVELYFFAGLNQKQIAERINMSQQSVSECLNGKSRNGKKIGGAIRKLNKACLKEGIEWPP